MLQALSELCRAAGQAVHYTVLAQRLGIHNTATYEMLRLLEQEGYVVVDGNYNRVKVKHPGYVALHHMRDSLNAGRKRMLDIIRKGESEEFLTYFPEYSDDFFALKEKYEKLVGELEGVYEIFFEQANGLKGKVNRKDFAALATKAKLPAYFFSRLDGKCNTVKEYIANMQIDHVVTLVGA